MGKKRLNPYFLEDEELENYLFYLNKFFL